MKYPNKNEQLRLFQTFEQRERNFQTNWVLLRERHPELFE